MGLKHAAPSPALTREALARALKLWTAATIDRQPDAYYLAGADAILSALGTPSLVGSSDYTLADFEAQFERTPPPTGLDLLREIWLQWPTTLPEELLLRVERALGHHPPSGFDWSLSEVPPTSSTREEPAP